MRPNSCLLVYPLRDEQYSVLTSMEMTVVIRSATVGWGVPKFTPNLDPLTHCTIARSISKGSGSPGTKICNASAIPTETGAFPGHVAPAQRKIFDQSFPSNPVPQVVHRHQFLEPVILPHDKSGHSVSILHGSRLHQSRLPAKNVLDRHVQCARSVTLSLKREGASCIPMLKD